MCIVVCFTSRLALRIFVFVSNAALSPLKIGGSFCSCSHTEGREAAASRFAHGFALHFHLRIVHGSHQPEQQLELHPTSESWKAVEPEPQGCCRVYGSGEPQVLTGFLSYQ